MNDTKRQISKIARIVQQFTGRALRDTGLGLSEYELIYCVRFFPGINQMEAAERLGQDKAAIARRVANLELKGYLRCEQDENDRRAKKLYETEQAREVTRSKEDVEIFFYDWLCSDIPEEDMEIFKRVLNTICHRAQEERCSCFATSLQAESVRHNDELLKKNGNCDNSDMKNKE